MVSSEGFALIDTAFSILDRLMKLKSLKDNRKKLAFQDILEPAFHDLEQIHRDYLGLYDKVEAKLPSFEFLSKPGTKWRDGKGYLNFLTEEAALRFLKLEELDDETLHHTLVARGYCIDYPAPDGEDPIVLIFRERFAADAAADELGLQDPPRKYEPPNEECAFLALQDLIAFVRETRIQYEPVRIRLRSLAQTMSEVSLGTSGDAFMRAVLNYFPDGSMKPFLRLGERVENEERYWGGSSGATSVLEALQDVAKPGAKDDVDLLNHARSSASHLVYYLKQHHKDQWEKVTIAFAQLQADRLRHW